MNLRIMSSDADGAKRLEGNIATILRSAGPARRKDIEAVQSIPLCAGKVKHGTPIQTGNFNYYSFMILARHFSRPVAADGAAGRDGSRRMHGNDMMMKKKFAQTINGDCRHRW